MADQGTVGFMHGQSTVLALVLVCLRNINCYQSLFMTGLDWLIFKILQELETQGRLIRIEILFKTQSQH